MTRRGYGWTPDLPDHRDHLYEPPQAPAETLPSSVDLRSQDSPIEDQGQLGSCTGNALAGAVQFIEKKDGKPYENVSRLFIYYNERVIENSVASDAGAQIRDGIKSLVSTGVCSARTWPYHVARFAQKPAQVCYTEAATHKVSAYARITTHADRVACLAAGFPFVFGFTVYESFEGAAVAQTGVVEMPASGERVVGGHAVLAVGYDDVAKRFLVRNSWGIGWGLQGYFTIPYGYLDDLNLADDMWTVRGAAGF